LLQADWHQLPKKKKVIAGIEVYKSTSTITSVMSSC
jgi:hypothetical protein